MKWCLTKVEKLKINLILTQTDNIDWSDKSIIDMTKLKEMEFNHDQVVVAINRYTKKIEKIEINSINMEHHQIVFGTKRWVPLHRL